MTFNNTGHNPTKMNTANMSRISRFLNLFYRSYRKIQYSDFLTSLTKLLGFALAALWLHHWVHFN